MDSGADIHDQDLESPPTVDPSPYNWLGLWTLYMREIRRFLKVYTQTLLAPVVTTLLFLAIFTLALGRAVEAVGGVPFRNSWRPA